VINKRVEKLKNMNGRIIFFVGCFKNVIDTFDQCLQDQASKVKKCVSEYTKSFNDIVYGNENNK